MSELDVSIVTHDNTEEYLDSLVPTIAEYMVMAEKMQGEEARDGHRNLHRSER